ncbi:MAG: hypothetical protein ABH857_02105 [Elusimicrobiota bacterium]
MNTIFIVCLIVVTCAISAAVVYLIIALIKVAKASSELEILLHETNEHVKKIGSTVDNVASLADKSIGAMDFLSQGSIKIISVLVALGKVFGAIQKFRKKKTSKEA